MINSQNKSKILISFIYYKKLMEGTGKVFSLSYLAFTKLINLTNPLIIVAYFLLHIADFP